MLTQTIPAYAYWQYSDDKNIVALFDAFNELSQQYVDFFNTINLPIYTGDIIAGDLLDWVAEGIYGLARPSISSGSSVVVGPLNTEMPGELVPGYYHDASTITYYVANDDIFKRILTWNFYRGDGMTFNIRWLKRRVMRFLYGTNGADPGIDQTYPINVHFGIDNQVFIEMTGSLVPNASDLLNCIEARVLNLPFQYTYAVIID